MITLTTWRYDAAVWSATTGLDGSVEIGETLAERCVQPTQLAGREDDLVDDQGFWVLVNLTLH